MSDLPQPLHHTAPETPVPSTLPAEGIDLEGTIAELERSLIQQALEKSRYSQKRAAQLLGLTPRSLRYRLQKYGMEAD